MTLENSQWWLHLLGVDTEGMPANAHLEFVWQNLPQSWQWWIVVSILLVGGYGIFWLYRREIDTCPMWAKTLLATLRFGCLVLLMIIVFGPSLAHTKRDELKPEIYLVRDDSNSMQHRDAYISDDVAEHAARALGASIEEIRSEQPRRVDVLEASLKKDDWKFVGDLQRRGKLHVVNFENKVELVEERGSLSDIERDAAEQKAKDPDVVAAALASARMLVSIAGGILLGAALCGFLAWYASSPSTTWSLGLIAAAALLASIAVAGYNAVQNPNIKMAEIVGMKNQDEPADDNPDGQDKSDGPLVVESIQPLPPLTAAGQGTDLSAALKEALSKRNTAAAVFFTDGQDTKFDTTRDELIALAAQDDVAREDRVPIFFVGLGDPNRPRNLAVSEVYADPQVFPNEEIEVRYVLRGEDVGQQPLRVDLLQQRLTNEATSEGEEVVIATHTDDVIPPSGKLDKNFKVKVGEPGRYGYRVRVQKIADESNDKDNESAAPTIVKVLDTKARVLLVAGAPTWEYRMVQRLLTREDTVNLSCWLQTLDENRAQEGNEVITKLPIDKKDLFEYDVVMLFDPDPIEFDPQWVALLKEFVGDHGGGVLYMAGPKFAGSFLGGPRTRMMQDVLPVRMGDVREMEVQKMLTSNTRAWPLHVNRENVDVALMRFETDVDDSWRRWNTMPGIYWSFPSQGAKPAARVLIEHSDEVAGGFSDGGSRPLLVTGQYGSGRTIYMGFNGTWRWRKVGHNAEYFKKFWKQTTRYLIEGRSSEGERRGYVETDKARYELADTVEIKVRKLKDENFNLYALDQIEAVVTSDGEQPRTLVLKKVPGEGNQGGEYATKITALSTGRHVVRVKAPPGTGEPPKIETVFDVTRPTVETNEVALNKALLVELAAASGGGYFDIDEIDKIPAQIPERVRHSDYRDKPRLLWDTSRVLLLLVALLSVEWAMRKGFKLL